MAEDKGRSRGLWIGVLIAVIGGIIAGAISIQGGFERLNLDTLTRAFTKNAAQSADGTVLIEPRSASSVISFDEFSKLQNDMTYAEVADVLDEAAGSKSSSSVATWYYHNDFGGYALIHFSTRGNDGEFKLFNKVYHAPVERLPKVQEKGS